jgi:hypothetical protein
MHRKQGFARRLSYYCNNGKRQFQNWSISLKVYTVNIQAKAIDSPNIPAECIYYRVVTWGWGVSNIFARNARSWLTEKNAPSQRLKAVEAWLRPVISAIQSGRTPCIVSLCLALVASLMTVEQGWANAPPRMAIRGKFSVNSSGAAVYSIPLELPPGAGGLVPHLSFDYASSTGDGIMGIGWAVSGLPAITHCPETVAQDGVHGGVNFDSDDRFCLEGQRLMVINGGTYGASGSQYRKEVDDLSLVIANGTCGNAPCSFDVYTKAGLHMQFGYPTNANGATSNAAIMAVGTSTVRVWALNQITDASTNYVAIEYYKNDGGSGTGEYHPTEIDYTGNTNAGASPPNKITFAYTGRTYDEVPMYQDGSVMETTQILSDIRTYVTYNGNSTEVYQYELNYQPQGNNIHYQLSNIALCDGSSDTGSNNNPSCLPATTFGWQSSGMAPTLPTPTTPPANIVPFQLMSDWNGDGIMDSASPNSDCTWNGIGYGIEGSPNEFYVGSPNLTYSEYKMDIGGTNTQFCFWDDGEMAVLDLNGDGYSDVLTPPSAGTQTPAFYSMINGGVNTDSNGNHFFSMVASNVTVNPGMVPGVGDFNGDGMSDIIENTFCSSPCKITNGIQIYLSNGDGTFTPSTGFTKEGGSYEANTTVQAADFDGDGVIAHPLAAS